MKVIMKMNEFILFSLNYVVEERMFKNFLPDENVRSRMETKISFLDFNLIRLHYWDGQALVTWVLCSRQGRSRFIWLVG